jgi:hypothetical protein
VVVWSAGVVVFHSTIGLEGSVFSGLCAGGIILGILGFSFSVLVFISVGHHCKLSF